MRFSVGVGILLSLCGLGRAQEKEKHSPPPEANVVTVPAVIDHNRVIVEAGITLPDGSMHRVRCWLDNGNPDLEMSRHLANLLQLPVSCDAQACSSPPPPAITIGGMSIPLANLKGAKIPLKPVSAASVLAPGTNAEINLPASVLRHYDVLVDFPGHKFTIGAPGSIHFQGSSSRVQINPENGLIQVPSQIENKKYNLALDLGSSISFLSAEVFDKLESAHAEWPHMRGAVGPANMWGMDDETTWKLMRVDRLRYGPLFLIDVPFVELPKSWLEFFETRAATSTVGVLGSQALLNYRVGLDCAHSTVYFDIARLYNFPDFDVIGLILQPEDDGRFKILGVADFDGKPSAPTGAEGVQPGDHLIAVDEIPVQGVTMGQVWSMLGGAPGEERKLTVEHGGKPLVVVARVRHFLAGQPDDEDTKKKK